jgi:hypothetical protein
MKNNEKLIQASKRRSCRNTLFLFGALVFLWCPLTIIAGYVGAEILCGSQMILIIYIGWFLVQRRRERRLRRALGANRVYIPMPGTTTAEKPKRGYLRTVDGARLEIIDDEDAPLYDENNVE